MLRVTLPPKFVEQITVSLGTDKWQLSVMQEVMDAPFYQQGVYKYLLTTTPAELPKRYDGNYDYSNCFAQFTLAPFPGCCGLMISTGAFVWEDWRKRGLGTILNKVRMHLAKNMGYTVLVCTDVNSNEPERKILGKNGWKDVFSFRNRRTGNKVNMSIISLLDTSELEVISS